MANAPVETILRQRQQRTAERRSASFINAKERFERSALSSGTYCVGRLDDGKPADTRSCLSLGMTINGWLVQTVFKRDDAGMLKGRDWRDVEADARAGNLPTRLVVSENHIITAVRELKHVREGYLSEIEATSILVNRIDTLNLSVADRPHPVCDSDISAVIAGLKELRPIIASKDSPLKQIVGLGRLDDAIRRFESVLGPGCKNRALELGRACAVLSSVPERLNTWRTERIAGGVAYTTLRESALRVERDKWVFSQLARFSCNPARIRSYVDEDGKKKEALGRVGGILGALDAQHTPLRRLRKCERWAAKDESRLVTAVQTLDSMKAEAMQMPWADAKARAVLRKTILRLERKKNRNAGDEHDLAGAKKALDCMKSEAMRLPWYDRVVTGPIRRTIRQLKEKKERAAENAGRLEAAEKAFADKKTEARKCIMANAKLFGGPDAGERPTRLSGNYSWLNRHIRHERLEEARAKLDFLMLFLDSNKPRFILDELSESPDGYMAPIIAELRPAVEAFEAKDLKAAQKHFAQAALLLRNIVYP